MKYNSVIIGHITKDINIDFNGNVYKQAGGAVLYSSSAAIGMEYNVAVITKMASKDANNINFIKEFRVNKNDLFILEKSPTCLMENKYLDKSREKRLSKCLSVGDPFIINDVLIYNTLLYQLAGLVSTDFSENFIKELYKKNIPLALDAQSVVRNVLNDGKMVSYDYNKKNIIFPLIKYLKVDENEAKILTNKSNLIDSLKVLYDIGGNEILLTYNKGVIVYNGKDIYKSYFTSKSFIGRTGRGDTVFSVYINERINGTNIKTALDIATLTVSKKMETLGPFQLNRNDIINSSF